MSSGGEIMKTWVLFLLLVGPSVLALSTVLMPYLALMLLALILPGVAFENPALIILFVMPLVFIALLGESNRLLFLL